MIRNDTGHSESVDGEQGGNPANMMFVVVRNLKSQKPNEGQDAANE